MRAPAVITTAAPRVDAAELPAWALDRLTLETVRAARRYFALPGVAEDYAVWLARQQAAGKYLEEGGAPT